MLSNSAQNKKDTRTPDLMPPPAPSGVQTVVGAKPLALPTLSEVLGPKSPIVIEPSCKIGSQAKATK